MKRFTNLHVLTASGLALALVMAPASAADDYAALFKAKKYAEAGQLASTVLLREPTNAAALIARVEANAHDPPEAVRLL